MSNTKKSHHIDLPNLFKRKLILDGIPIETTEDLQKVYKPRYQRYKATPQSLLYTHLPELHTKKMNHFGEILSRLLKTSPSATVLDIGCGYGSLAAYIPAKNYQGIDIIEEFICDAQEHYPQHRFTVASLETWTEQADICVIAGSMSAVPEPFMLVEKAWSLAKKSVLVDFFDEQKMQHLARNPDSRVFSLAQVEHYLATSFTSDYLKEDGSHWSVYYLPKP